MPNEHVLTRAEVLSPRGCAGLRVLQPAHRHCRVPQQSWIFNRGDYSLRRQEGSNLGLHGRCGRSRDLSKRCELGFFSWSPSRSIPRKCSPMSWAGHVVISNQPTSAHSVGASQSDVGPAQPFSVRAHGKEVSSTSARDWIRALASAFGLAGEQETLSLSGFKLDRGGSRMRIHARSGMP